MTDTQVKRAADKAHYLDAETRHILAAIKSKNNKAVAWFLISWSILLVVGVGGIYRQNQIALQNKKHIDCIVKLFTIPLPANAHSRQITNPSTTCNVSFSK